MIMEEIPVYQMLGPSFVSSDGVIKELCGLYVVHKM